MVKVTTSFSCMINDDQVRHIIQHHMHLFDDMSDGKEIYKKATEIIAKEKLTKAILEDEIKFDITEM